MTDRKPLIAVAGSFMMDLVFRAQRRPSAGETIIGRDFGMFLGGKGLNQALTARRLGASVEMIGRLGRDAFGDQFVDLMQREGIGTDHVMRDAAVGTGVACPVVSDDGANSIIIVPRANLAVTVADVEAASDVIANADVLMLQLEISPAATWRAAEVAKAAGRTVVLNPAPAPAQALTEEQLRLVDVITPNEVEALTLTGIDPVDDDSAKRAAARLRDLGIGTVVLTLGARGALLMDSQGTRLLPGHKVGVVDTTGAGDAFNGGLAYGLACGLSPDAAVELANVAGALAVTKLGAVPSMPSQQDVSAFRAGIR